MIFSVAKIYNGKINIFDRSKSLFIGLGIQSGSSFGSILDTVILGGSIGAGIALRGIRVISERKYDINTIFRLGLSR